jgi:hypothetical protein
VPNAANTSRSRGTRESLHNFFVTGSSPLWKKGSGDWKPITAALFIYAYLFPLLL